MQLEIWKFLNLELQILFSIVFPTQHLNNNTYFCFNEDSVEKVNEEIKKRINPHKSAKSTDTVFLSERLRKTLTFLPIICWFFNESIKTCTFLSVLNKCKYNSSFLKKDTETLKGLSLCEHFKRDFPNFRKIYSAKK